MHQLREKFNELSQGAKLIISIICFIFAEINLLVSIVLISNFVSAVNDLPRESKEYAKYCNPNFFRSRNGILTMDLFLFFTILGLLVIIFIQKNQYVTTLNYLILLFFFMRLILSFVFLGDPNENYIATMREGYYNEIILDPFGEENIAYKEYYDSWDTMYENEILQFFLLNIPIMVGAFIIQALKLETLPIREQFSFSFSQESSQQQQQNIQAYDQQQYYNYHQISHQQQQQQFHKEGPPIDFQQSFQASQLYRNYSSPQEQQQSKLAPFFPEQQKPFFTLPKKEEEKEQEKKEEKIDIEIKGQQFDQQKSQQQKQILNLDEFQALKDIFEKENKSKSPNELQNINFD